jgi:hypothetical protein
VQPADGAGPFGQARGLDAVLDATGEEDLHADADAQYRAAAGQPALDDPVPASLVQALHAGGEGTDPWHQQPVGRHGRVEVTGDLDIGADMGQGPLGGAHVTESVIEDDHALGHAHSPSSRSTPAASASAEPMASTAITPFGSPCLQKEMTPPSRKRPTTIRMVDNEFTASFPSPRRDSG